MFGSDVPFVFIRIQYCQCSIVMAGQFGFLHIYVLLLKVFHQVVLLGWLSLWSAPGGGVSWWITLLSYLGEIMSLAIQIYIRLVIWQLVIK